MNNLTPRAISLRVAVKFRAFGITFGSVDTGYIPLPNLPGLVGIVEGVAESLLPVLGVELFNKRGVQVWFRVS